MQTLLTPARPVAAALLPAESEEEGDEAAAELEEPPSGSDSSVDSIRPLKASTLAKMPKAEGGTETRIAGASGVLTCRWLALPRLLYTQADELCALAALPRPFPLPADWVKGMSKDQDGTEADGRGGRGGRAADSDSGSDPGMEASAMRRVSKEQVRTRLQGRNQLCRWHCRHCCRRRGFGPAIALTALASPAAAGCGGRCG
jgi:hypothetical protein